MTPKEIYEKKRKNFIEKTQKYFEFLIVELDFENPSHTFSNQPNGVIISDKLEYEHKEFDKMLIISNSYHPNDYGFEINWTDLKNGESEMFHYVLKENQEIEQKYLKHAAEIAKKRIEQKLQ